MSKKKFVSQKQKATIEEIVAWKTPTFHQASECYVGSVLKTSCKPILLSA